LDSGKQLQLTSLSSNKKDTTRKLYISQLKVVEDGKVALKPSRIPLPTLRVVKSTNCYRVIVPDLTAEEQAELIGLSAEARSKKRAAKHEQRYWSVQTGYREAAFRTEEDDPRPWMWPVWRRVEVDTGYTREQIRGMYQARYHQLPPSEEELVKYLYTRLPDLVHIGMTRTRAPARRWGLCVVVCGAAHTCALYVEMK
jgi:hypothetical protein